MAKNEKSRYTYKDFCNNVLELVAILRDEETDVNGIDLDAVEDKAQALLFQQEKRAAYNAEKRANAPKKPKELSEGMKALVDTVKTALKTGEANALTGNEINAILNANYYPMQIANACAHIEKCVKTKVVRQKVNSKGLKQEQEYTAYYLEG